MSLKKSSIEGKRHSLAHLLAATVVEMYPGAKNAIGPAIENGFYQDFETPVPISEEDFQKIEAKMRKTLKTWTKFERKEVSAKEARKQFDWNPYKLELIEDLIRDGQQLTFYTSGNFIDLCRGGHADDAREIDPQAFKLTKVSGAYWHGDQSKQQLQRIYGVAFESKKELDQFTHMREEAEKRDHRKLGKELDLFVLSSNVGPGLPLLTPKGSHIRYELEKLLRIKQIRAGYQYVTCPHIGYLGLYKTSGHYPYYAESMFPPIQCEDDAEYMLKPMNCPHHIQIYSSRPRSYRELPIRYAEYGTVYRYEKSGELGGLTRVRCIAIDDAHIFCAPEQLEQEINGCIDLAEEVYRILGLTEVSYTLSLRDPENKKKYVGGDAHWDKAESILRQALKKRGVSFTEHPGEAAFYGPKIDVKVKDVLGRHWQLATIPQVDYNMPERFDLHYIDEKGEKQRPIILHRAIYGSYERFMGLIIEHFGGAFPTWLAPVQVAVLPVAAAHETYAKKVRDQLFEANVRVELMAPDDSLGKRIREAETQKIPYALVLGDKEIETGSVAARNYHTKKQEVMKAEDFMKMILEEIKERKLPQ